MNAAKLLLHEYYSLNGERLRYMGNNNGQYIFYNDNMDQVTLDDTEMYVASLERLEQFLKPAN